MPLLYLLLFLIFTIQKYFIWKCPFTRFVSSPNLREMNLAEPHSRCPPFPDHHHGIQTSTQQQTGKKSICGGNHTATHPSHNIGKLSGRFPATAEMDRHTLTPSFSPPQWWKLQCFPWAWTLPCKWYTMAGPHSYLHPLTQCSQARCNPPCTIPCAWGLQQSKNMTQIERHRISRVTLHFNEPLTAGRAGFMR